MRKNLFIFILLLFSTITGTFHFRKLSHLYASTPVYLLVLQFLSHSKNKKARQTVDFYVLSPHSKDQRVKKVELIMELQVDSAFPKFLVKKVFRQFFDNILNSIFDLSLYQKILLLDRSLDSFYKVLVTQVLHLFKNKKL